MTASSGVAEPHVNEMELVSPEEAARALKVSRKQIYRFLARGDMHGVKVGRGWRVNVAEFIARGGTR